MIVVDSIPQHVQNVFKFETKKHFKYFVYSGFYWFFYVYS